MTEEKKDPHFRVTISVVWGKDKADQNCILQNEFEEGETFHDFQDRVEHAFRQYETQFGIESKQEERTRFALRRNKKEERQLLDKFAMAALQTIMGFTDDYDEEIVSANAYKMANAMIEERKKQHEKKDL